MKKRWYSIITLIGSLFMMLALIPNSYSKYKTTYDVGDINIGIDYDNLINVTSGKKWDGYGGFVSLTDATNYACTENPILLRVGDIVTFTFPLNKNYNFSYYLKTSDSHSTDAIYVNSGWLTPTSDNTYSFTLTSPQTLLSNSVSVDITSCFLAVNMYVGDGSLPIDETTAEDMKKCISVTRNTDVSNYREVAVTYGNTEYDITGLPTSVLYGEDLKVEFLEGITIEDLTIYEAGTEVNIVNSTNVHSGKYTYNSTRHILYVSNVTNPIQIDIALKPCYLSYEGLDITNLPTECAFGSSIDIDLNNKDVNFVEVVDGNGDPIPLNDGTSGNVFNQFTNILHLNKVTSDLKIISYSIGLGSATLSFANGIDYKWERRQTGYFWNKYYVFDKSQKNTGHISSDQLNIKPGDSIRVLDSYVNGKPYYFSINVLIYTLNNNDATFIDINNDGNYDNNDDVWVGHNNEFSISYDDIISILGGPTTDNIYLAFNIVKKDPESTDGSYYIQETFSADLIEEASEYIVINDKSIYSTAVRSLNPGDTYTIVHSDTFDFSYSFFTLDTNNQFVKVAENSVPTGDTTMTYKNARSIANLTDPTQKLYAVLTFAKKDSTEVTLTDKYTIMTTLVT
ncbi:MAG: hypothetical protein HUJ61_05525, partial [Bacilli bacterium]|nr:hypothetical protein [Bacilli bacterium]